MTTETATEPGPVYRLHYRRPFPGDIALSMLAADGQGVALLPLRSEPWRWRETPRGKWQPGTTLVLVREPDYPRAVDEGW